MEEQGNSAEKGYASSLTATSCGLDSTREGSRYIRHVKLDKPDVLKLLMHVKRRLFPIIKFVTTELLEQNPEFLEQCYALLGIYSLTERASCRADIIHHMRYGIGQKRHYVKKRLEILFRLNKTSKLIASAVNGSANSASLQCLTHIVQFIGKEKRTPRGMLLPVFPSIRSLLEARTVPIAEAGQEERDAWFFYSEAMLTLVSPMWCKRGARAEGVLSKSVSTSDEAFVFWVLDIYKQEWEQDDDVVDEVQPQENSGNYEGGAWKRKGRRFYGPQKASTEIDRYHHFFDKVAEARASEFAGEWEAELRNEYGKMRGDQDQMNPNNPKRFRVDVLPEAYSGPWGATI